MGNSSEYDQYVLLITSVQAKLYAYVFSLLGDPHQAADVLQETNLVLWRKSAEYVEGTNFVAWAFRVAHFQVMAFRQKLGRDRLIFDDLMLAELTTKAANHGETFDDEANALNDCMKRLSDRQRELLHCHYTDGQSIHDMATSHSETMGAISQALFRTRVALMKCIEKRLNQEDK